MHVNWTIKYFVSSIIHALLIIHWQISLANGNHVIQDRENEACNPASSFPAETCMDARNFGHAWCRCTPIQPSACIDPGEREGGGGGVYGRCNENPRYAACICGGWVLRIFMALGFHKVRTSAWRCIFDKLKIKTTTWNNWEWSQASSYSFLKLIIGNNS